LECGTIGIDLDEVGGVEAPVDGGCILATFLLLTFRFWPANLVSGEAVRRGVNGLDGIGNPRVFVGSGDGEEIGSLKTSFNEVFGPVVATCQGDAVFPSAFSIEIRGWLIDCCMASCCCFLRSFCESFGGACLLAAVSIVFCAERLIDNAEVLLDEAWAMISRISSFDDGSDGDDHVFRVGGAFSCMF